MVQALCLGAACASQQLAWFLTPFLLVGLYAVRRGELGPRPALAVVARYTGTAALTWAAINAYFATQDFPTWLHGLLLPLTQKAILHGQGLMGISYYFTAGSRHLDYYSYASLLLLLGLLAATLLFVRRLGPAITVLPWLSFYLATRSQDGYFLMMTPLWLAAAATVPAAALASAWRPRIPRLTGHRAKAVLAAALVAPAVLCATVAAASAPPLRMHVTPSFVERATTGTSPASRSGSSTSPAPGSPLTSPAASARAPRTGGAPPTDRTPSPHTPPRPTSYGHRAVSGGRPEGRTRTSTSSPSPVPR